MRLAALLVAVWLAGCSLLTLRPIEPNSTGKVECVDSYFPPVIDTVLTVGAVANGVYLINDGGPFGIRRDIGIGSVIVGGVTAVIATLGYYRVSKCRRAQALESS